MLRSYKLHSLYTLSEPMHHPTLQLMKLSAVVNKCEECVWLPICINTSLTPDNMPSKRCLVRGRRRQCRPCDTVARWLAGDRCAKV